MIVVACVAALLAAGALLTESKRLFFTSAGIAVVMLCMKFLP